VRNETKHTLQGFMIELTSELVENGNKVSVEYSIETGYGVIVANDDSDIALAIIDAYGDPKDSRLGEISICKLQRDYPSINVYSSSDSWCGSIKDNVIFCIEDTRKDINLRFRCYDAFYTTELEPDADAKRQLNEFATRFGIEDEPGVCIWGSLF
jgi:hypothetical protein